ncbi:MAG: MoaD/ThiS family protein [Cyclobacteriaceae bacterium]
MAEVTSVKIKLIAYGIAKDILGGGSKDYVVNADTSIGELKQLLINDFPEFEKLRSLKFAINEEYQSDDYVIIAEDEVVIIPPVSGG